MTIERDLAPDLERALTHLPSVPPTTYLTAARKVRRRRRVLTGAAASVTLVGGLAFAPGLLDSPEPTPVASMGPSADRDTTRHPVTDMPALEGVPAFTTVDIPKWAQEYGNNGPVAMAPDNRLWVAPGAEVLRAVVNFLGSPGPGEVPTSYAVEARYEGATTWVTVPMPGIMDDPGRWTNDFELWVDNEARAAQGRPTITERLVHFVGPDSDELAANDGAELVRQISGVELPSTYEQHPRTSVAEVRWGGRTWFVVAHGPRNDAPFYEPYERAVSAPDLDSFVEWLGATA